MFVITVVDVKELKCKILDSFDSKKDAIEYLYNTLGQKESVDYVLLEKDESGEFVKQYKRDLGYLYNNKHLEFVYQIQEHTRESQLTKAIKKHPIINSK